MKIYKYILWISLSLLITTQTNANQMFYFTGYPQANTSVAPDFPGFQNWCQGSCFRTTQFPLFEPKTGRTIGTAYVWEKDVSLSADYSTICLGEFVELKLREGSLYLAGSSSDSCGALMNPALVKPVFNPQSTVVIFSGLGTIVNGTRAYKNIRGIYDVKLKLEALNNSPIYYDYLFYNITLQ